MSLHELERKLSALTEKNTLDTDFHAVNKNDHFSMIDHGVRPFQLNLADMGGSRDRD